VYVCPDQIAALNKIVKIKYATRADEFFCQSLVIGTPDYGSVVLKDNALFFQFVVNLAHCADRIHVDPLAIGWRALCKEKSLVLHDCI
jgi:hypothetical protein